MYDACLQRANGGCEARTSVLHVSPSVSLKVAAAALQHTAALILQRLCTNGVLALCDKRSMRNVIDGKTIGGQRKAPLKEHLSERWVSAAVRMCTRLIVSVTE